MCARIIVLLIPITALFVGCGPKYTYFQKSVLAFHEGKYLQSEAELVDQVQEKKTIKHPSYPLMLLTLGDAQFRLGDYQNALQTYDAAAKNLLAEVSALKAAGQFLKAEHKMLYRGEPHDLALVHYYIGLCYFMLEDYPAAQIEFAQARLEDKGEQAGQEDDVLSVHFMEGLCYKRLGDEGDAAVSFRKVTELNPEFPYGWYELALIMDQMGELSDANDFWEKYITLVPADQQLERDDDVSCIFVIADFGNGPFKKGTIGSFWTYKRSNYSENDIEITLNRQNPMLATKTDDIYFQAKSEGGFAGDAAKKAASVVTKKALQQIPLLGSFVPNPEADLRVWFTLPGEIHMAMIPADPGHYVMTANFFSEGKAGPVALEGHRQNWYYISPQKHSEVKPIIILSKYRFHDRNVDHEAVVKKYKPSWGAIGPWPIQK